MLGKSVMGSGVPKVYSVPERVILLKSKIYLDSKKKQFYNNFLLKSFFVPLFWDVCY